MFVIIVFIVYVLREVIHQNEFLFRQTDVFNVRLSVCLSVQLSSFLIAMKCFYCVNMFSRRRRRRLRRRYRRRYCRYKNLERKGKSFYFSVEILFCSVLNLCIY